MARRVLVVRPEPGNAQTAARLVQAGFEPVLLPLTRIEPLDGAAVDIASGTKAVAITSPNALRHAPSALVDQLRLLPVFAVGHSSAASAREHGLNLAACGNAGAKDLAWLIAASLDRGSLIAYPCGRVRRPEFERALTAAGYLIQPIETYDTAIVSYSTETVRKICKPAPFDAVLVHSSKAADALGRLTAQDNIPQITDKTLFFCLSARIGRALQPVASDRLIAAGRPDESELLDLLRQHIH